VRNCIYCTVQNLLFAEIVIIPLDIWSSADLSYLTAVCSILCKLCSIFAKFWVKFWRNIQGKVFSKDSIFPAERFWKLSCEILTKVSLPQVARNTTSDTWHVYKIWTKSDKILNNYNYLYRNQDGRQFWSVFDHQKKNNFLYQETKTLHI